MTAIARWEWEWPEPGEPAYVSVPGWPLENVQVHCPNCGRGHKMPMDGPVPKIDDGIGQTVDWDKLMPFIWRYRKVLEQECKATP